MKKFFTMAVMSLAVLAVSCSKEDKNQETPEEITPKEEVVSIEGTWVLESLSSEDKSKMVPPNECQKKWTLTFSQSEVKSVTYPYGRNTGDCENKEETISTYTISDNKLTLKNSEGKTETHSFVLDKNNLTLTLEEGFIFIFKRKN